MRAREFTEPTAAGIILYAEDTGRWGLQQRSDTINDPGMWAAWGGGREPGETLEQTARRELAEESGYRGPIKLEPLARNAKYATFIGIVPHEFEPRPCDEWKDYCWVELGKWPSPMHPGVAAALENVYIKESVGQHQSQDLQDVADWLGTTPNELSIEVKQEPIDKFIRQIREMYSTYDEFPEDEQRTNRILKMLQRGAKPMPIYVEAGDPDLFVMEGRHRMVAFWLTGMKTIPVAYASKKVEENVTEAFNKPYKGKWEKSESGSYDMLARLPDGTNLSIMFNNEGGGEWQVEFYRNNSQEVTGEGDAQRIFATVLGAIEKFIKKHNPLQITFSASKEVEPGQNSESRAKLYNRLVDRYAAAWGYDTRTFEHGNAVSYELSKYSDSPLDSPFESAVAENFHDGRKPGRKGLSRRVGIPKKASLSKLQKIASSSTGERRRMAQWQLNMRRGKAKKNK